MSDGGKGSNPRPFSVPKEQFDNNWNAIFGKKDKKEDLITSTPAVEPSAASTGDTVYGKSTETQSAREDASASKNTASNIVVNAPVNNNTTQQQSIRSPFRNEDPTVNRYVDSRFA